nr:hypothetical protein [Saprospiraceae bacterium]
MNFHELQELIKLINKSNLTEFKFKDKDVEVQIKTDKYQKTTIQTVAAAPAIQMAQVPTLQPAVQTMERQDAP